MTRHVARAKLKAGGSAWVIRAGIAGGADSHFMRENIIVLRDQGLRDLSRIEPRREAFYQAYKAQEPNGSRTTIAGIGGKFFRFMHEMRLGDIVLYPRLRTREVFFGKIIGNYRFVEQNVEYPHQREVKWIASFPKDSLTQHAQYELGAARTLFQYKNNLVEILERVGSLKPKSK